LKRYTSTHTALPVFVSTNESCTLKGNLLLLLLLMYTSMFVHAAPIYADVFSIFSHSIQLSCGRNNTKMARANYEICTVMARSPSSHSHGAGETTLENLTPLVALVHSARAKMSANWRCSVVRSMQKSMGNSTPYKIVIPENFVLKLGTRRRGAV